MALVMLEVVLLVKGMLVDMQLVPLCVEPIKVEVAEQVALAELLVPYLVLTALAESEQSAYFKMWLMVNV
jgi:hypothetical protein